MKDLVIKRDKKKRFYVRPYLGTNAVTGKPLRPYKCFPEAKTEKEARRAAEAWAAGIERAAELKVRRRLDDLLLRYVDWLADTNTPINTVKSYRSDAGCLAPFFEGMDPDDVTSFDVEVVYRTLMRKGGRRGHPLAANTVCRMHGFMSSAWAWMLEKKICSTNPMPYVHKPSREKGLAMAYSDAELAEIMDALVDIMADDATDAAHVVDRNLATATYAAVLSGIREGEACGLDRGDVARRTRTIVVSSTAVEDSGKARRQGKTKGKKVRNVPASGALLDALDHLISWQDTYLPARILSGKPTDIALFCDRRGRRFKPAYLSRWFSALRDRLGLPAESHFHTLRHTFASVLLDEKADLRTIAELLGHAREGFTLETYAHMMPGRDRAAVDALAVAVDAGHRGRDP